jgi:hypothetical protein
MRSLSTQYSHIADRINACTAEHVKLGGRSARKSDLPVSGAGSGRGCPASKLEATTAERLADMTGQAAPANNPVLECPSNVVSQNCNTAFVLDDLRSGSNARYGHLSYLHDAASQSSDEPPEWSVGARRCRSLRRIKVVT